MPPTGPEDEALAVRSREVIGEEPEAQVIEQGLLVGGKREGEWVALFPDGSIWSRRMYKDGLLEGRAVYWDSEARLQTDTPYQKGKLHGLATGWHANGRKAFEMTWKTGVEEGPWREWYDTGQLKGEGIRIAGNLDGRCICYLADGSIDPVRSGIYSNGKKVSDAP